VSVESANRAPCDRLAGRARATYAPRRVRVQGIELGGVSIGGIETFLDLPEWKLGIDLGRVHEAAVQRPTLLFTHAHIDHMGAVVSHAALRHLRRAPAPTYVIPRENEAAFAALFAAWRELDRSELAHRVVPLAPGEEFELPCRLIARPFRSPHRVATQGYALWSKKRKLRPEFAELPQTELDRRMREEARAMTDLVETPEFAFSGDTLIELVEREEVVRRARVLVLECTFLDERVPVDECRSKGHTHLDEIVERAELFQNEALVLSHFSARYKRDEVLALLDRKLPPSLKARVTPFLEHWR
jgi:ribonuclease Z